MAERPTGPREGVVLVGTTLEPESDDLVALAATWARHAGASLHVLHAFPAEAPFPGYDWIAPRALAAEEDARRVALQAQLVRLGLTGSGSTLAPGPAHEALAAAAEHLQPMVMIVGASRAPFGHVLGSTAERVVRQAAWPVLVARPPLRLPLRSALAAVDLSPLSLDALRCALGQLQRLGQGEPPVLEVLFVLRGMQRLHGRSPRDRAAAVQAHRALESFVGRARDGFGGEVFCRVLRGEPRGQILRRARRGASDLVVLGTHGVGGFRRYLVGSIACGVLRDAPCSVLVVPPEAAARGAVAAHAAAAAHAPTLQPVGR